MLAEEVKSSTTSESPEGHEPKTPVSGPHEEKSSGGESRDPQNQGQKGRVAAEGSQNEVYQKVKNATVSVKTVTTLRLGGEREPVFIRQFVSGSGFFIRRDHFHHHDSHHSHEEKGSDDSKGCKTPGSERYAKYYIVCPAHLVLLQGQTLELKRFPVSNSPYTRVERIFVQVYNVNGTDQSFAYEADLVGFDGAGDTALLKINHGKKWNRKLPVIEHQPFIEFEDSIKYGKGEPLYVIGDALVSDFQSVSKGVVRDNHFLDPTGTIVHESVLTDATITPGNSGSPMVSKFGKAVGMVTFFFTPDFYTFGGGPSQRFMKPVLKALIEADQNECRDVCRSPCSKRKNHHVKKVEDIFGDFFVYVKGYMGFNWTRVDAFSYIDLLTPDGCSSVFVDSEEGPKTKKILGIVINQVDGAGGCSASSGVSSPFLGKIIPGDIITHIDDIPVGCLDRQIIPTLVTWRLGKGDKIKLTYRKAKEFFREKHCIKEGLAEFPPDRDMPLGSFASREDLKSSNFSYLVDGKLMNKADMLKALSAKGKVTLPAKVSASV